MNNVVPRLTIAALASVALAAVAVSASSCSRKHEPTASTVQGLDAGISSTVSNLANTPSAVLSGQHLAVGFTSTSSSHSPVSWAQGDLSGTSWSTCDANNVPSGCNGPSPTPKPGGVQTWLGKGAMAADGTGKVVYVVLASSSDAGATPDLLAALVSTDDGRTFKASQIVNDASPGGTCAAAIEDLPDATFDYTTNPPTLWIAWRHQGASSFGGCVRRGMLNAAGVITWLDVAHSVGGMDREDDLDANMGQGGLRIQAGDGVVTIGYSNNDQLKTCNDTSLIPVTWGTVSTYDNGQNWANTGKVFHTDNFLSCPFGSLQNGNRAFDFVRTNDGTYYFAAAEWAGDGGPGALHVFSSSGSGTMVDSAGSGAPGHFVWREWCPGYVDVPDGGVPDAGPASNWAPPGVACPAGAFAVSKSFLFPTFVADGQNQLGLLFYDGTSTSNIHAVFEDNLTPRMPSGAWQSKDPLATNLSLPSGGVLLEHLSAVSSSPQTPESCSEAGAFFAFHLSARTTTPTLKATPIAP